MALWQTREQALAALSGQLHPEASTLEESFDSVDQSINRLAGINSPFARVTGLIVAKARNLTLGCYSLSLDALAQESGALLRPLLEALELLRYLRLDPSRVEEALDGRLPKAGVIAQRIGGEFKGLREHLNVNASHVSLNSDAMLHLVDWQDGSFKAMQPFSKGVLRRNLHLLFAVFVRIAIEAVNCVSVAQGEVDHELADRVEDVKKRGLAIIGLAASEKS